MNERIESVEVPPFVTRQLILSSTKPMVTTLMVFRAHGWRLSKMTDEKYVEISSKALKAKKAIDHLESELANIFSEVSKEDMAEWLQIAEDDDKISKLVFNKAIDGWRAASHPEEVRKVSPSETLLALATLKMLLD